MTRVRSRTAISQPQSVSVHDVSSCTRACPLNVPPAHGHAPGGQATVAAHYTFSVVVENADRRLECATVYVKFYVNV